MKTSNHIACAVLSLLAAGGVHAEEYHGVQSAVSILDRAEVNQQAVKAAHAPNQNIPSAAIPMAPLQNARDRASVEADAIAAAHNPVQNLGRGAFFNSNIPVEYTSGSLVGRTALGTGGAR